MRRRPSIKPPARIAEVAKLAGVSPATVSRALTNPALVSEAKRVSVLAAVRSTGYQPNSAARSLRARRSMMVLVFVPNIANTFFAEVLHGIEERLADAAYGMIIANLGNSAEKEARYVDLVFAGQVDGVLLLNGRIPESHGRSLELAGVPVVVACERLADSPYAQVDVDNREASKGAVAYLAGLGHTRIAYLSGPAHNTLEVLRRQGFVDGLKAAGLAPSRAVFLDGDFTARSGAAAGRQLLAMTDRPTALHAANDEMAIGFIKSLHGGGLRCPHDISVVGFDGIDFAEFCEPALTTIRQPRYDIGSKAASLLVEDMQAPLTERKRRDGRVQTLSTQLLVRDSCRPLDHRVVARRRTDARLQDQS